MRLMCVCYVHTDTSLNSDIFMSLGTIYISDSIRARVRCIVLETTSSSGLGHGSWSLDVKTPQETPLSREKQCYDVIKCRDQSHLSSYGHWGGAEVISFYNERMFT